MRNVRLLAAAAVGVLLVTACGLQPQPGEQVTTTSATSNPYEDARRAGVEDLLQRWAKAVRDNDVAALAEVIDPAAAPELLESETRRAAAVANVPLADWGYELVDEPEVPVPSAVASPLNAADVWAPSVVLRYAIEGPDAEPTRRAVSLLVAERDDRWRIVSDAEIPGIDRRTWRGPWDFGSVVARSVPTAGGMSVILGHPEQAALMDRLERELPAAVDAVSGFYGDRWPRTALVLTSGSTAEFAASAGEVQAAADVAAVTVSDVVVDGRSITGQRVVFGPAASDRLTDFTTRSVLRHELTHVAARADTTDGSPMWVLEGFADYSGYRGADVGLDRIAPTLSRIVSAGGPPTVLPEDSDFTAGGVRSTLAYESAWSVCAFVADRYGEPALRSLYAALATGPKTENDVDSGLRSAIGIGTADLVREWGSWVADQSG